MHSDAVEILKEAKRRGYVIIAPRPDRHRVDPHAALVATYCLQFGLTPAEAQALAALVKGNLIAITKLHRAISNNPVTTPKIVSVTLCKLRKKLRQKLPDVKITSVYKFGYRLDPDSRKKIRQLLDRTEKHA